MICFIPKKYYMENINRKERRDKDWVCRVWLQIAKCCRCLFDNFCSFEDRKNEIALHSNDHNNDKNKDWNWEREWA